MKPLGPLPPEFATQTGDLVIAGRTASTWVAQHGSPLFVYDPAIVAARIRRFRAAFPRVDLHFAIKANPYPPLLAAIAPQVDGFDVASAGELAKALVDKPAAAISFAGPGKRDAELDSGDPRRRDDQPRIRRRGDPRAGCRRPHRRHAPRLAVRVNPDLELRGSGMRMGGRASPFGVDAERAAALARGGRSRQARTGAAGTSSPARRRSTPQALIETQAATLTLAARLSEEVGRRATAGQSRRWFRRAVLRRRCMPLDIEADRRGA